MCRFSGPFGGHIALYEFGQEMGSESSPKPLFRRCRLTVTLYLSTLSALLRVQGLLRPESMSAELERYVSDNSLQVRTRS